MSTIALYIKSYRPDAQRLHQLLQSIEGFNADQLPVYVSVNDEDYSFFKQELETGIHLLKDSELVRCKLKDGWRYQQVVKAHFYRLDVCDQYVCIDSDSEFIRPFYKSDFMYDDRTPYTVMHEGKAFLESMEILGRDSADMFFLKALKATRQYLGTHGKNWDYGPSPYIWSCKVWHSFVEDFLQSRKMDLESFFIEFEKTALPSEAVFYGEYLLKTRLIDIVPIEALFKVYHYQDQYDMEAADYDREKLAKNYLGIVRQSNWHTALNISPAPRRSRFAWLFGGR